MALGVGPAQASSARLRVVEVLPSETNLLLTCLDLDSNHSCQVALTDSWVTSRVKQGDTARVIRTDENGQFLKWDVVEQYTDIVVVSELQNLFILHPDVLLAGSSIADSVQCPRKTVMLVRNSNAGGAISPAAFYGNLIHELFQAVIVVLSESPDTSIMDLFTFPDEVLSTKTGELYKLNITENEALTVLHDALPKVHSWFTRYYRPNIDPPPARKQKVSRITADSVAITGVRDIEELVWSPCTGLKGMVDATVSMKLPGRHAPVGVFELKTGSSKGQAGLSHHAQVALYKLLLSDRYDTTVTDGMVSYIPSTHRERAEAQQGATQAKQERRRPPNKPSDAFINSHRGETIALVQQRNIIATYVHPDVPCAQLPEVIQSVPRLCQNCFVQESCLVQNRLLEGGSVGGMGDKFDQELYTKHTAHLNDQHAEYYHFWRSVLAAEEAEVTKFRKELWTSSGELRLKEGTCVPHLKLLPEGIQAEGLSQNISLRGDGKHVLTFVTHAELGNSLKMQRRRERCKITRGDYVMISVERVLPSDSCAGVEPGSTKTWKPALASGFVKSVKGETVQVSVDRNLLTWAKQQRHGIGRLVWRLDSEEIMSSHRTAKSNLERLFSSDIEDRISARMRRLIVDGHTPVQNTITTEAKNAIEKTENELAARGMKLNEDQQNAMEFFAKSRDYICLLGMPGTGKSLTLAAIIMASVAESKTVLLCSHTHSAVDTVLLKLLDLGYTDFARVGRVTDVTDDRIIPYVVDVHRAKSVADLEEAFSKPKMIASTCLGVVNAVFSRRTYFDHVVVDEAAQILQPICLGPVLFASEKFVLVGDHHQLPPLLRARNEARKQLADWSEEKIEATNVSLFRWLCERHPESVVRLKIQYRMAEDIMALSNRLVYNGALSCGSRAVAEQKLTLNMGVADDVPPWLQRVADANTRAIFVDIDACIESRSASQLMHHNAIRDGIRNSATEANVVIQVLQCLLLHAVPAHAITILTPFRAQVALLLNWLEHEDTADALRAVRVFTVDQYQGRDNDCVIVSFVRGNADHGAGPLLEDWRRVNVALTRAKKKLVLVGSKKTLLTGGSFLQELMGQLNGSTVVAPPEIACVSTPSDKHVVPTPS